MFCCKINLLFLYNQTFSKLIYGTSYSHRILTLQLFGLLKLKKVYESNCIYSAMLKAYKMKQL